MEGGLWQLARVSVLERGAFAAVRREVYDEIQDGGRRFSERQRDLVGWQQVDFVPTFAGIAGGCGSIAAFRKLGFMGKSARIMILLPAIPFYVLPYQAVHHMRESRYLVEMMREDKTSKFARRLRNIYADAAPANSTVLDELDSGAEITDS
mmetsp:Transcript_87271/g.244939  ORF Transcript_87271/g.244939 Transcript_87271/m.244939 type:complete len:151 (-) Transcript_87271:140-592(-)